MKELILIVEDEAVLYKRLKTALKKMLYRVGEYCASVDHAIELIEKERPDLILLDIDLEGEKTGIDLGAIVNERYQIPIIYVTNFGDDHMFHKGLQTGHEHFMVKTKPRLDVGEVTRVVQTALQRANKQSIVATEGIIGYTTYLEQAREERADKVIKIPIKFEDIVMLSTAPFLDQQGEEHHLKTNYLWFLTEYKERLLLRSSLADVLKKLPYNFIRVNEKYIVNLTADSFKGSIHSSRILVDKIPINISERYKKEFKARFHHYYGT